MSLKAHVDFEGGAPGDLKRQGVYRWIEHPEAQCWCMSWRIGNRGPVNRWHPGDPDPVALLQHVANGGIVVAHNAYGFELVYWNLFMRRKYVPHWPPLKPEQMDCTMIRCLTLAIPGGLDIASHVLGINEHKDKAGYGEMQRMARPRKRSVCIMCAGEGCQDCSYCGETFTWWNEPLRTTQLGIYCDQDVVVETAVDDKTPPLSDWMHRVVLWDHKMNSRGFRIDMPLVRKANEIVAIAKQQLDVDMRELTNGVVKKCTEVAKLTAWVKDFGIPIETLGKEQHDNAILLAEMFDAPAHEDGTVVSKAIELRRSASKTSTAKYQAIEDCICADDKARGQKQVHGASTGRWAGRLIQPDNLPRVDEDREAPDVAIVLDILQRFDAPAAHDAIAMIVGDPMFWLSRALRSMIIASPGCRLVGGDLSNIEGCFNAWISGESWKITAYNDNFRDPKNFPGLYELAYSRSFGIDVRDVSKANRQIGKVEELSLGYQGAVGAFISMGANYGLKPKDMVAPVYNAAPAEAWAKAIKKWKRAKVWQRYHLLQDEWVALRVVTDLWRAAHPMIERAWYDEQDAAIEAVAHPGEVIPVLAGKVKYLSSRGFLWCQLPSGRLLAYCRPRLIMTEDELTDDDGNTYTKYRRAVEFEGYDGDKKQWLKQVLYGGLQHENITQAGAYDVICEAGLDAEDCGYPIVLTVHDELLGDVPLGHGNLDEFKAIMKRPRDYRAGLPLDAKVWEDVRYG